MYKHLFRPLSRGALLEEAFYTVSKYLGAGEPRTGERMGRPTGMNSIVFLSGVFMVKSRRIDNGLVSRDEVHISLALRNGPVIPNTVNSTAE